MSFHLRKYFECNCCIVAFTFVSKVIKEILEMKRFSCIQNVPASNCAVQKRLAVALILLLFILRQDVRKQYICAPGNMRTICMEAVVQREIYLQKPNLLNRSKNTADACC